MDTKKFLMGTLAGGFGFFFVGYLIYGMATVGFFNAHVNACASRPMEEIVWWALIVGNISSGALLSYIFVKWANINTFGGGLGAAATIGFFLSLSMDMVRFSTSSMIDMTGALGDVVAYTLMSAICGGITGAVLGMGKKA